MTDDLGLRIDADEFALSTLLFIFHYAGHKREQGIVGAASHIIARFELRAALAHKNLASQNVLTSESLDAQALRVRIATVS
jgi:hypothetical protein